MATILLSGNEGIDTIKRRRRGTTFSRAEVEMICSTVEMEMMNCNGRTGNDTLSGGLGDDLLFGEIQERMFLMVAMVTI